LFFTVSFGLFFLSATCKGASKAGGSSIWISVGNTTFAGGLGDDVGIEAGAACGSGSTRAVGGDAGSVGGASLLVTAALLPAER
jgi:hypothetical protein